MESDVLDYYLSGIRRKFSSVEDAIDLVTDEVYSIIEESEQDSYRFQSIHRYITELKERMDELEHGINELANRN